MASRCRSHSGWRPGDGRRLALRLLEDNPEVAWVRDGKDEVRRPADEAALRWLLETECRPRSTRGGRIAHKGGSGGQVAPIRWWARRADIFRASSWSS